MLLRSICVLLLLAAPAAATEAKRWNDDDLVAAYAELVAGGRLDGAIRSPKLPGEPPSAAFLDALAWYAAGAPDRAGVLTTAQLSTVIDEHATSYRKLLAAKVESGADNDYPRTRTWKLIQKLTLLANEMAKPSRAAGYPHPALPKVTSGDDTWERDHTLRSAEEFADKVCRASYERPVLVKYGNTNCTQCMLFEMLGSIQEFAKHPAHEQQVDVYKVWFGYQPDASFAGKIRNPARLDDLAKAEGVKSSPTFVVYRNGRRYPCGDAFPDAHGTDAGLDKCLHQEFGEAPAASVCAPAAQAEGKL